MKGSRQKAQHLKMNKGARPVKYRPFTNEREGIHYDKSHIWPKGHGQDKDTH